MSYFFNHQQYWASIPERFHGDVKMCAKVRQHTVGVCELGASGMHSQRRTAPIGPPGGERVTMCSGWWNVCYTCWPEFSDWFTSYQASPWRSGSKVLGGIHSQRERYFADVLGAIIGFSTETWHEMWQRENREWFIVWEIRHGKLYALA